MAYIHEVTPVLIHGANSTSKSFNYMREVMSLKDPLILEYSSDVKFSTNLEEMRRKCKTKKNLFFIGHSLGGIYAAHLSQMCHTVGAVTISTPYGGSILADITRFFHPTNPLLHDIATCSPNVSIMQQFNFHPEWTQVVTTRGHAISKLAANDGVVTQYSMMALGDKMKYHMLPYNHFEIKMAPELITLIREKIACVQLK
jgi:hypothetical protein